MGTTTHTGLRSKPTSLESRLVPIAVVGYAPGVNRPTAPLACVLLAAAPLIACSSGTKPPRFQVVSARTAERTADGVRVELTVVGENPNKFELELGETRYSVSADGNTFFTGLRSPEVTLPRYGRVEMVLPAAAPIEGFPADATSLELNGWIEYLIPGPFSEVLYDAGLRRPTASVEGSVTLTP